MAATRSGSLIGTVLVLASVGLAATSPLPAPSPVPVADFVQYWAAARVVLSGGNPYDWNALLAAERQAEPGMPAPVMMWNPPWTIAVTALPAMLPYEAGRIAWAALSAAMLVLSAGLLWHCWGGKEQRRIPALAVALWFPASVFALVMGQVSPVMLLGLAGFMYFERRGCLAAAGAAAALTLVKPQVVHLFWAALLLWSLQRRRWRVLLGAAATIAVFSALPMIANPGVFADYFEALRSRPPDYFVGPTLGTLLRLVAGWRFVWLMYLPAAAGLVWLWFYWTRRRATWDWRAHLSWLCLASVTASPYTWLFDQVVLLVPVLEVAADRGRCSAGPARRALGVFGAGIAAAFVMLAWNVNIHDTTTGTEGLLRETLTTANMFWHVTIAPVFLAGYALYSRRVVRQPENPC